MPVLKLSCLCQKKSKGEVDTQTFDDARLTCRSNPNYETRKYSVERRRAKE